MLKLPLFYSVLLAGPTIALYVYYLVGQTYMCASWDAALCRCDSCRRHISANHLIAISSKRCVSDLLQSEDRPVPQRCGAHDDGPPGGIERRRCRWIPELMMLLGQAKKYMRIHWPA